MNDVLASVVESLGRTTLCLAAVGAVVAVTLRLTRTSWPAAHRLGWVVTLLVGWTFLRLPVVVPWYEAPATAPETAPATTSETVTPEVASVDLPPLAPPFEPFAAPDAKPYAEPVAELPANSADEVIEIGPAAQGQLPPPAAQVDSFPGDAGELAEVPLEPVPPATKPSAAEVTQVSPIAPPVAPPVNDWPRIVLAAWLTGMVVIVAASAIGYVGFVRRLAPRSCREVWQQEWSDLVAAAGVHRAIPLRVTAGQGPMLCRLPRGMELVVPERLWRDLSPAARRAILRHELAHYLRGDVWKSLAARVLALPHWFNPMAWLAVRRFEEAAEWACDAAAANDSATDYARVLLQLGESAPQPAYASSAGGRTLAARIRRVLAGPARPDSRLKKTAIVTVALLLVGASLVQLDLVAKQPSVESRDPEIAVAEPADAADAEDLFAAPPRVGDADPVDAPSAETPNAVQKDGLHPKSVTQGSLDESTIGDQAAAVAEAAYHASKAAFEAENSRVEPLYDWSVRWMNALERAAPDNEIKLAAAQAHVKRMYDLNKKCRLLYQVGTKGGEAQQYTSTRFYLAEAERHLAELKTSLAGENNKDRIAVASIDATALDTAKQAYRGALREFESGQLNIGDIYEWSERWREQAERVAIDQNGRTQAAQDHLDRLRDVSKKTEAFHQAGKTDGNQLNAAKSLVAEAERQVADANIDVVIKEILRGEAEPAKASERAEAIKRLEQDVLHFGELAKTWEVLSMQFAPTTDVEKIQKHQHTFEKRRDQARKRLTEISQSAEIKSPARVKASETSAPHVDPATLAKEPLPGPLADQAGPPADLHEAAAAPPNSAANAADTPEKRMVSEAAKAYDGSVAAFLAQKSSIEPIHEWSRRWMQAAESSADDVAGRIAAAQAHLDRMRELHARIAKLRELQSQGGEDAPFFATKFYISEAERHLAEVKAATENTPAKPSLTSRAKATQSLADVKQAYLDAQGRFESGKLSLDGLFEWSERYRQAAERAAADQAGKVQAAQDHLERMKEAFRRIEAANQAGLAGVDEDRVNAAKVFVAEAERHLAEVKAEEAPTAIDPGQMASQTLSKETSELVYRLKRDVEHYNNQARAWERLAKQRNLSADEAAHYTQSQKAFEKLRDDEQKRLTEVLRDLPQPGSLLASTDPAQQKLRSDIEVVDLEMKIAELTGQLQEAKIAQDGASRSLSDSRGKLTPKERQSLESEKLQGMAKIETLNRQLTLLNKKLAMVKQLSALEKEPAPQPAQKAPKPTTGAGKTLRYGGRTFDEWVAELKDDLSPEHRAEAVKAMSLFATRGHAQAAGEAILDAMREYSVFRGESQPIEQLKEAARETFRKLPKDVGGPLIEQALKSDQANLRMFALYHRLSLDLPESERVAVLTRFLSDPDAELRVAATTQLVSMAPETPGLLEAIRGLCTSDDPQIRSLAAGSVRNLLGLLDKDGPKKEAAEKILAELGPDAKVVLQAIASPPHSTFPMGGYVDRTPQRARQMLNRLEGKPDEPEAIVPPATVPAKGELNIVPAEVPVKPDQRLTPKADPLSKLRYNGKPFHAWAETLREDLSPESRTEAIEALAMFGRFGLAEEAAKEILAAMRDYSVWSMDGSAEGKLKFAATKAFKELPEKVTRPLLTTALASDSGNQRLFAATILSAQVRDSQEREKLFAPLLDDSDAEVRRLAAISLQSQADKYLAVVEIMREAVASPDNHVANWAVQIVGIRNPQPFVPILPTLVERLDTEEQPLLQQFQMALLRFGPLAIPALEEGEQSENRRVRAMSQQTLQQIRSAAPPVASEDSPQKPATEPAHEASYRNKTFKAWLSILRRDLSPESRTEAIRALAVFAAHGHAREVGEAILEMMGDYSIFDMSASPDAPLKVAALDAFGKLDRGAAFPLVDGALKSENANRRMFAATILDQWVPKDNSLDLDELLADPDPTARLVFAGIVVHRDVTNATALEILRSGLESSDEKMRASAFGATMYLISQLKPGQGVEGPVLEALKQLGPALKPIIESAAKSDAPNQAEVQAALRLLSFNDEPKK